MVEVGGREVAAPPAAETLPERADESPDGGVCESGRLVTHTKVNRQSRTGQMEGFSCSR